MGRLVVVLLVLASVARAQVPGMYCVGVDDDAPHASLPRTITMDGDALDCLIKLPAKQICRAAVAVAPGEEPPAVPADVWLCYAVRCPRENTHRRLADEFGTHDVRGGRGKLYCTAGSLTE